MMKKGAKIVPAETVAILRQWADRIPQKSGNYQNGLDDGQTLLATSILKVLEPVDKQPPKEEPPPFRPDPDEPIPKAVMQSAITAWKAWIAAGAPKHRRFFDPHYHQVLEVSQEPDILYFRFQTHDSPEGDIWCRGHLRLLGDKDFEYLDHVWEQDK